MCNIPGPFVKNNRFKNFHLEKQRYGLVRPYPGTISYTEEGAAAALASWAPFLPHMAAHIFLGDLHVGPHSLDRCGDVPPLQGVQNHLVLLERFRLTLHSVHDRLRAHKLEQVVVVAQQVDQLPIVAQIIDVAVKRAVQ